MIEFVCIDRLVDFDKDCFEDWTTEIRVVLKVDDKRILDEAKEIDDIYFNENCFGIGFNYVHNEHKIYLLGEGLYYVDNGGDDNYIDIDNETIIRIQDIVEKEYLQYLENPTEYKKNSKFEILEDEI